MSGGQEKWAAVLAALDKVVAEMKGTWPVPRKAPVRAAHLVGYSRERGRSPIIKP